MRSVGMLFLVVICTCLWVGFVRAESLDRIVAVVNDDIILYSELQDRIKALGRVAPQLKDLDPADRAEVERQVLQEMVRERLTAQEIKRLKISVAEREVDEAVKGIQKQNNLTEDQLKNALQQEGKTFEEFREEIKKEMERARLVERVLKSKTVITEKEIDAYLSSGQMASKERRRLAVIFIPEADPDEPQTGGERLVRDLYDRLKGGADFAQLAREYSRGPAAEEGGDIGYIESEDLLPQISKATHGLGVGAVTRPVKASGGYYIMKVLDVQREKQEAADSMSREKARRELFEKEINAKFEKWIQELQARSFIQITL